VKRSIKILFHSGIVTLTSPSNFLTGTIFLHAHLQAVYYNCVKFHLNPMSRLGGVALTSPFLHTERISEYKLNYPPSKFWTATICLHAHLQVVYYNCVKFHKNPISCLGGVALKRYMPSFFSWKYKLNYLPFLILDSDHISSCTSAGSVLQLCKVSQKSNKPFRRSCAYKVHDPPFRESVSWIISPSKF
jgi:hypothetical protein